MSDAVLSSQSNETELKPNQAPNCEYSNTLHSFKGLVKLYRGIHMVVKLKILVHKPTTLETSLYQKLGNATDLKPRESPEGLDTRLRSCLSFYFTIAGCTWKMQEDSMAGYAADLACAVCKMPTFGIRTWALCFLKVLLPSKTITQLAGSGFAAHRTLSAKRQWNRTHGQTSLNVRPTSLLTPRHRPLKASDGDTSDRVTFDLLKVIGYHHHISHSCR